MKIPDLYTDQKPPARIYEGGELVYPEPVKDGLVLWYDFMGRKNSDAKRGIAEDLSGNGNHGELTNFAHTVGSGYEDEREYVGQNLLLHSNEDAWGNYTSTSLVESYLESNKRISKVIRTNGTTWGIVQTISYRKMKLTKGKQYTLSFKARGHNDVRLSYIYVMNHGVANQSMGVSKQIFNNQWTDIVIPFVFNYDSPYSYVMISSQSDVPDGFFEIMDVKVEEGPTATPWRPAMEDLEYEEWAKDKGFRRGLNFEGVDDRIIKPDFVYPDPYTGLSWEICLTLNSIASPYQKIIGDDNVWGHGVFVSNGQIRVYSRRSESASFTNGYSNDLKAGVKSHIICILENDIYKIYLNGLEIRYAAQNAGRGDFTVGGTGPFYISTRILSSMLSAAVFSARVYNRALTPEEVAHNYAMEKERWNL